jgi:hypothetical protein
LGAVAGSGDTGEILRRALSYPYATPNRSYLYHAGSAEELPAGGPDLSSRVPLLAYGANAAPEALARKLAPLPEAELPVLRAKLHDFDVVYSAHVSPYGTVPATLKESGGTRAPVFVLYPNEKQLRLVTAKEPNYDLVALEGIACGLEDGTEISELAAYISIHGSLQLDGSEVALAAVRSLGRTLPELDEPAVLERARAELRPNLDLESFVRQCIEEGGIRPLPRLGAL